MKKQFFLIFSLLPLLPMGADAANLVPQPRISIQAISDRSARGGGENCGFYGLWSTPGDAVREVLTNELQKIGGVTLLEREHISDIYEKEFQNENLDPTTVAEKKKFVAANFAVAGTISEFEWCRSGGSQGLDVGSLFGIGELSVQHKSSKAHVGIDLRLIDVKTGKILKTFKSEAQVDDSSLSLSADIHGVRMNKDTFEKSPLGKATQIAMADAAGKISESLKEMK